MSTISAGTLLSNALVQTGDTSGNLVFQTNGNTTAMTIDTNQNVTYANGVSFTGVIAGNGANISSMNASNLTSGTVATARLPTVPVASGGTGQTSLTANNVILGNATAAVQFVAPGSTGNVLTSNGTTWVSQAAAAFDAGTRMIFAQTSAPTGWTKDTTNYNNHALRVVTGAASTGGSVPFTTAFASQTPAGTINTSGLSAGATTLSTSQIPSHNHSTTVRQYGTNFDQPGASTDLSPSTGSVWATGSVGSTGGGGSHSHSISGSATFTGTAINLAVQYLDVITATKN